MDLKYRIKELIEERGIRQEWLANKIGMHGSGLSNSLRIKQDDRKELKYSYLVRIADILEVTVEELHYDHQAIVS